MQHHQVQSKQSLYYVCIYKYQPLRHQGHQKLLSAKSYFMAIINIVRIKGHVNIFCMVSY